MKERRSVNCDVHQKISHMVPFSCLLILLIKEILTFSAKSNYVISNTVVVFSLYLLFAFLNGTSVIRMVVQWNLSTNMFVIILMLFVLFVLFIVFL
jgi:hypothetical protein